MRILLLALLLTGCGSACSSSSERLPKPESADQVATTAPSAPARKTAEPPPPPPPPPPPKPLDADDERVVYVSPAQRTRVRFAAQGDSLLVADTREDASNPGVRLTLQDLFGRASWEHDYARVDDLALEGEDAFALADGHLYRYALDSGEPTDLGEAQGQLVLTDEYAFTHHLGVVKRVARAGGKLQKVADYGSTAGFHRIAIADGKLVMLVSAFRNRPARNPKLGWLLTAPEAGGKLKVRFDDMFSPGPQLELDGGYAYFGASRHAEDNFDYEIQRLKLEGKGPPEVVVHHHLAVFAVEGDALYAAARLGDKAGLYRFSLADEADPVLLSAFEGGATRVLVADSHLYWESRGRIYRLAL